MTRAEQQVAAILAELREQAARNQEVGYPDAVVHLQAAEAAVHAAAGLGSPDERLREALLSDAAVEAAAMTYEPDTFIGDAPNADDALRDARAVLEAALAAADREKPDECRAPHCWSEYGTPCATCPAATPDPPTDERRPWPIAPDTVMPPRRQPVRWGSRADDPPTEIHDDPGKTKAYLAGLAAGRTEAAAVSSEIASSLRADIDRVTSAGPPTDRPRDGGETAHARTEKLRIVSDGTPSGTRITTGDGDELLMVTGFVLSMPDPSRPLTGSIDVLLPKVDVVADCEIREVCPYCGTTRSSDPGPAAGRAAATPDPPPCRCPDDWRYDDGSVFCPQHQTKPDAPAVSPDERLREAGERLAQAVARVCGEGHPALGMWRVALAAADREAPDEETKR